MQHGGRAFNDAVVQGLMVPSVEALQTPEVRQYMTEADKDIT
jgi:hypothetical protein